MMAGSTPTVAHDTMRASGFIPRLRGLFRAHQNDSRGAIVDAGCISGGYAAFLAERRTELRQRFHRGVGFRMFVGCNDRFAFARFHGYRNDFVLETTGSLSGCGFGLRGRRKCVLCVARKSPTWQRRSRRLFPCDSP